MKPKKILVVDDEPDITELVSYNLRKEGFTVDALSDGEQALAAIRKGGYDLLVLDVMLPGIQGLELCRTVRSEKAIRTLPIIMLTARSEEVDRIVGLEMGADDYVTKPFSPRELIARIKAVLRRASAPQTEERTIHIGPLVIDREAFTVTRRGAPIVLSSTEFRLLLFLAERKGKIFSRDQLLDAVWSSEAYVDPRTVDVHIRRLRAQIEDDPSAPSCILTKRGLGYFMDGDL